MILSEWLKFSLQLNCLDETTRNNMISFLLNLVQNTASSFDDYEYLLKDKRFHLNNKGDIINDFSNGETEMPFEEDEEN